jgi:biotin-(acetyl-CoA carboxylase) ligase
MNIIGSPIRVRAGRTVIEGIAEEVTAAGNLLLRRNDGSIYEVVVGDVTVIKT